MGDVKLKVKRIGVLSLAMYFFMLFLVIGLFIGIATVFVTSMVITPILESMFNIASGASASASLGLFSTFIAIPIIAIALGIVGFITGAISALIFNLVARLSGGIEIKVEETEIEKEKTKI